MMATHRKATMIRYIFRVLCILFAVVIVVCLVGFLNSNGNTRDGQSRRGARFLVGQELLPFDMTPNPNRWTPPGELGSAVSLGSTEESVALMVKLGYEKQGLNQYVSDLISVRRKLPDIRADWCREQSYSNLPSASIVIVFYNEAWSVLVRTVHSILDRSPVELVREIVLVDDFSYLPHLKTQLEDYMVDYPKVRIVRAPERLGLMRARLLGAQSAVSDVLVFLDAHVECTEGWLEALLDPVARNWTTISIPTVDWIDENDMHLRSDSAPQFYGAYDWDLNFGWWVRDTRKKKYENKYEPFDSPAMSGGLFCITRRFFEHLGWYDEGFEIYGVENIELSMKSWMCGGKMVTVPCSRVGHIQKTGHPYMMHTSKDVVRANSLRLAEVWMDEYKHVIFDIYGIRKYPVEEVGELCSRREIRHKANCKSFRYYVENAFPEMRNPMVKGAFRGAMRNRALDPNTCLEYRKELKSLTMVPCDQDSPNQFWTHNYYRELNTRRNCIDFTGSGAVLVFGCHRSRGNQEWENVNSTGQFKSVKHGKCLAVDLSTNKTLKMEDCDANRDAQMWLVDLITLDVSFFSNP
ncbi:putative polypeptide N-acetylgalactosaminyltransferase 9 [Toxorhynchites rutilus septentrionalis]|uniref:putative polypeptide N-acetylgalactosaminyltransferase 9 n=1 Tax=Toxorhynchites rutilus septentrionalis TaxID=329112 RepID=UPI002479654E|nr:putative polypeptide N-acetylgalactosaminyltransferase 9 [Toxorhynchites rutilus septentrionalis]